MRSPLDRLRHALSFEILALLLVIPLGAAAFDEPVADLGVVGVTCATVATAWNLLYNVAFDFALLKMRKTTRKTPAVRVTHAVLFEGGLLVVLAPFIACYLEITLLHAMLMNVAFSLFYVLYALGFNWAYDKLFPLPEWEQEFARNTTAGTARRMTINRSPRSTAVSGCEGCFFRLVN